MRTRQQKKRQNDKCQVYESPESKRKGKHLANKKISNIIEVARVNTGNDITVEGEDNEIMVDDDANLK